MLRYVYYSRSNWYDVLKRIHITDIFVLKQKLLQPLSAAIGLSILADAPFSLMALTATQFKTCMHSLESNHTTLFGHNAAGADFTGVDQGDVHAIHVPFQPSYWSCSFDALLNRFLSGCGDVWMAQNSFLVFRKMIKGYSHLKNIFAQGPTWSTA